MLKTACNQLIINYNLLQKYDKKNLTSLLFNSDFIIKKRNDLANVLV